MQVMPETALFKDTCFLIIHRGEVCIHSEPMGYAHERVAGPKYQMIERRKPFIIGRLIDKPLEKNK
jgi:hypothetical protein